MDTVNMANQMVNFQGKEISLDDFMIMYDNFKNMMGKVSKKFLEPIEVKGDKKITLKINPDHENDYVGGLEFVRNMLIAKGEQQPLRLLFQAWMVAKEDFCYYLKELILHSTIGDDKNIELCHIVMPFDGIDPMFRYDDETKSLFKLLNNNLKRFEQEVSIKDSKYSNRTQKKYEEYVKDTEKLISEIGDLGIEYLKRWINYFKADNKCSDHHLRGHELIQIYRVVDLGEYLFNYDNPQKEAC